MTRLGLLAGLALTCTVGFGVRFYATFGGARDAGDYVIAFDSDPYYHLRRLEWWARNGRPLVEDPFAAAPARFACPWPVALEGLTLALDGAVFHGERGRDTRLLAAGFLPVLVGLATLLVAFVALARQTSPGAALAGAATLAVWPGAVHVSSFFAFDHHGLELLVFVLLPAAAAWAALRARHAVTAALAGALVAGGGVLAGDGALLALSALGAALALMAWRRRPGHRMLAFTVGALSGLVAASLLEALAGVPRLLPRHGAIGIGVALVGLALANTPSSRRRLAGVLVIVAGGALAASAVLAGARYLTAADSISANIAEALPLWRRAPASTLAVHAAVAAAALGLAFVHARRPDERGAAFFSVAAAAGALLGLAQTKYVFLFGLAAPWVVASGIERLRSARRSALLFAAACVLALFLLRTRALMRTAPTAVSPDDLAFAQVARAARAQAPDQESYRPGAQPEWTIVLDPSVGPRMLWLSERAVTSVPFWGAPALAAQFKGSLSALLAPEELSGPLLDRLHARYVLATDLGPSLPWALAAAGAPDVGPRALYRRLLDGAADPARFRLVAAAGSGPGRVALYERAAPPGWR